MYITIRNGESLYVESSRYFGEIKVDDFGNMKLVNHTRVAKQLKKDLKSQ